MSKHNRNLKQVEQLHFLHSYGEIALEALYSKTIDRKSSRDVELPPQWEKGLTLPEKMKTQPIRRIAIIGAGVAGLQAATMLGEDFKVDVFEANKRIGGRLYTHRFESDNAIGTRQAGGEFDYFDVGAMRFPDTEVMRKTFDLFHDLGVPLIPYRMLGKKTWLAYNGKAYRRDQLPPWETDPFCVGESKAEDDEDESARVPDEYATRDPSDMLYEAIRPFLEELIRDREKGLEKLLKEDGHSTRSFLSDYGYPTTVIDYIETMCFGTGGYDRALAETVLEELCFRYNQEDSELLKWKCVQGGSHLIPLKMVERLKSPEYSKNVSIFTGHQVTRVLYEIKSKDHSVFTVSGLRSGSAPGGRASFKKQYSHVIFAIPPPCIRTIDISTCRLDYSQRNALRQVSVGPSCKIGMKFKTAWWNKAGIRGGQSSTDRMARTIVYPSHGDGKSTVLIVSYSWTQDAVTLSSLMQGRGTPEEERLKDLMLADLASVHQGDGITIDFLREQYEDMFPWDWTHHPLSMGAFGMFGPSQFRQFYGALSRTAAKGHMHFIGETISTTHGWVAGALESAERGVYQLLKLHQQATEAGEPNHDAVTKFKRRWNPVYGADKRKLKQQLLVSYKLQIDVYYEKSEGAEGERRGDEGRGEHEEHGEHEGGESGDEEQEDAL